MLGVAFTRWGWLPCAVLLSACSGYSTPSNTVSLRTDADLYPAQVTSVMRLFVGNFTEAPIVIRTCLHEAPPGTPPIPPVADLVHERREPGGWVPLATRTCFVPPNLTIPEGPETEIQPGQEIELPGRPVAAPTAGEYRLKLAWRRAGSAVVVDTAISNTYRRPPPG